MEAVLTRAADYLWRQSWQIALLIIVVALTSWALRNRSAHVRYLLWLLVLAKCLTPPVVQVPLAVLPDQTAASVARTAPLASPRETLAERRVQEGLLPTLPPSSAPAPLPPRLDTRQWFAVGWLAGLAVFVSAAVVKMGRTTLWLRRARRTLPEQTRSFVGETFRSLRLKRLPKVWLVDNIGQPFVWGILRGAIYLPARFAQTGGDEHRRDVLAHEIGHVLRFDAAVNILQIIAQAVFWFHPLLWWANQRIRREREKCCDEMAIAHLGARPKDYSAAIVSTLIQAQESTRPVPSLAVAGPVKNIEERIRAMLRPGREFHTRPSLTVAAIVVLIALLAVPTTVILTAGAQAQPASQTASQPAADSEKPEQPRYAARTFNSTIALDVWRRAGPRWSRGWWGLGRTPSSTPLEIPACYIWWVRPAPGRGVKDWDLLVGEIKEKKVPGLVVPAGARLTDSDLKRLADCTGLEFLVLSGGVTDAGLELVKGMTGLLYLDLNAAEIGDAGLEHLKGLTKLECLELYNKPVGDTGLAHLKGLTRLERLMLDGTKITDAGLEHLKDLPRLQQLDLRNTRITNAGLAHLKSLTTLQDLSVERTQITDAGLAHLKNLTALQRLWVGSTQITDASLTHLESLSQLEFLDLSDTQITDAGLAHLKGLTRLGYLVLVGTRITDAGLEQTQGLGQLEGLVLSGTQVTDGGLEQLKGLAKLRRLILNGIKITDAGLAHLKGLSRLQTIHLSDTQITGAGLAHLQGLTTLESLYLCRATITDAGLAHLPSLTGQGLLNLYGTKITDAGLEHLKSMTGLRWLVLSGTQITDAGLEHLNALNALGSLYLTDTSITDAGLDRLRNLDRLWFLDLSGTQVTKAAVTRLKQSFPKLNIRRDGTMEDWIKKG